MKLLMFIIGLNVGGIFGVVIMCLLQVNRLYKHDMEDEECS